MGKRVVTLACACALIGVTLFPRAVALGDPLTYEQLLPPLLPGEALSDSFPRGMPQVSSRGDACLGFMGAFAVSGLLLGAMSATGAMDDDGKYVAYVLGPVALVSLFVSLKCIQEPN